MKAGGRDVRRRYGWPWCVVSVVLAVTIHAAWGSPAGGAVSLDTLLPDADIVFKGTVRSSTIVPGPLFKSGPQFEVHETVFKVQSVIHGAFPGAELSFRHFFEPPSGYPAFDQIRRYSFATGRSYLVVATRSDRKDGFRQVRPYEIVKVDHDVILCLDDRPIAAPTVKEAMWEELNTMLQSANSDDVFYAITQLDEMSMGPMHSMGTNDFDRGDVLTSIHDLVASEHPAVAEAAIKILGDHNPYLTDDRTHRWLITVASAEFPGIARLDKAVQNRGGKKYWRELIAVANGEGPPEIRALAIRALGFVRTREVARELDGWLSDKEPDLRAAATILLADYPSSAAFARLIDLAVDPDPKVRAAAATTVGIAQAQSNVALINRLLSDEEETVRYAAARSLLSFSSDYPEVANVLSQHRHEDDYWPSFMIALATVNPAPYAEELAQVIESRPSSELRVGGTIPYARAWNILFGYVQGLSDRQLTSRESHRYFDALEKLELTSSSPPRDLYAFYLRRGLVDRARAFRTETKEGLGGALEEYFERVDANAVHQP